MELTDIHSKRTDIRHRFRVTLRWVARLVLISIVGSWLFLYLDSVYQRRRAEAFVADVKSLDFATADFTNIRDLVIRNGGTPMRAPSLAAGLPDSPTPSPPDLHGNIGFDDPWPTCTRQNCMFIVWINTRLARLPFWLQEKTTESLYSALPYFGVRTWGLGAIFVVRNGKLERSQTIISEYRIDRLESEYPLRLIPLGYEVETVLSDSDCLSGHQGVFRSHGNTVKFPVNFLYTCVLQTASTSTRSAFDLNLSCLNGIFRGCRFGELAPSAWADYSAKNDDKSSNDPQK